MLCKCRPNGHFYSPTLGCQRFLFIIFFQHLSRKGYFKACILFKNIICNFVRASRLYTRGLMALWCAISETRCPKWLEASFYNQQVSMASSKHHSHGSVCVWGKKKKATVNAVLMTLSRVTLHSFIKGWGVKCLWHYIESLWILLGFNKENPPPDKWCIMGYISVLCICWKFLYFWVHKHIYNCVHILYVCTHRSLFTL